MAPVATIESPAIQTIVEAEVVATTMQVEEQRNTIAQEPPVIAHDQPPDTETTSKVVKGKLRTARSIIYLMKTLF